MATAARKQDMPPEGGYKAIPCKRIPARKFFNGPTMFAGYIGITAISGYVYFLNYKLVHREDIEQRSGRLAIHPLLLAERDREYLKQLRRNRDEEAKLMANVEGWKVGTYYGEPIYKSNPDAFIEPTFHEYYEHTDEWSKRLRLWFLWLK